jgi:hypothetical protein
MTRDGDLSEPTAPPPDCGDGLTVPRDDQSNELLNSSEQLLKRPNRKKKNDAFNTHPEIPTPRFPSSEPTKRSPSRPGSLNPRSPLSHLTECFDRDLNRRPQASPGSALISVTSLTVRPRRHQMLCSQNKKGMRHPVGGLPSCHHLKRHIRDTFCRPNMTLTAATMDIHGKHHGLSSQRSRQYYAKYSFHHTPPYECEKA